VDPKFKPCIETESRIPQPDVSSVSCCLGASITLPAPRYLFAYLPSGYNQVKRASPLFLIVSFIMLLRQ